MFVLTKRKSNSWTVNLNNWQNNSIRHYPLPEKQRKLDLYVSTGIKHSWLAPYRRTSSYWGILGKLLLIKVNFELLDSRTGKFELEVKYYWRKPLLIRVKYLNLSIKRGPFNIVIHGNFKEIKKVWDIKEFVISRFELLRSYCIDYSTSAINGVDKLLLFF